MKKSLTFCLVFIAGVCFASTSLAFDEGIISLSTSSKFQHTSLDMEGIDATETDITLSAGYFIRENLEIALFFASNSQDNDINGNTSYRTIMPNFSIYFPLDENYISLGLGYELTSGDYEGSSMNFGAGYLLMITEALSFNLSLTYGTGDLDAGSGSVDYDGFGVGSGFTIYFTQ